MTNGSSVERLAALLRARAATLPPGGQLPSTRDLMAAHGVGPGTVSRAIGLLGAEGVLVTEAGRGTFVSRRPARREPDTGWQTVALGEAPVDSRAVAALLAPAAPGALVLSSGYPSPDLQPLAALAAAATRAARRPGGWALAPPAGLPELRQLLATPVGADAGDVLVVPGGQAGLSTALRALTRPGAAVLVEVPTYLGALATARAAGLRPVPVPTDGGGVRADLLPEAFASSGARLLYLQPTYANPTGTVLAHARRAPVLEAARQAGAFVLEDDWARHLALDGPAPPPLVHDDDDGRVVHLSSLSKAGAPSLRIGALIARGPAAARLAALRQVDDFGVARPLQETAVELLGSPAWPRHLGQLARALRARRDHLVGELHRHLPELAPRTAPAGGLHLWLTLPTGTDDVELADRARSRRLLVGAGRPYFVSEPPGPRLRVGFAAADRTQLTAGVRLLAETLSGEPASGFVTGD
ncbi:MAG TPA: PLP-dependent aminotransferase family protein [Mycobacteriales bacterium]|nr:PLP-dependent aminotransferase family protein [Mycobacteriales bacterium]